MKFLGFFSSPKKFCDWLDYDVENRLPDVISELRHFLGLIPAFFDSTASSKSYFILRLQIVG